jgi:tetratricopeptide (TPR) repeat protein
MALAVRCGDPEYGANLCSALFKGYANLEAELKKYRKIHPMQFIYWDLADYYRYTGNYKSALTYINNAIAVCDADDSQVTLNVIRLGIIAAKITMFTDQGKFNEAERLKETLLQYYHRISDVSDNVYCRQYLSFLEDSGKQGVTPEILHTLIVKTKCIN